MTSSRPYLIRAMYQWIIDNGMTPHLLADAAIEGVDVPATHIKDGKIVLNLAPMAIQSLILGDEDVTFSARFDGHGFNIYLPMLSILAIYARENGQGMMFSDDSSDQFDALKDDDDPDPDKPKPTLRVVK